MALSKELCGILVAGAQKERAAHDFYLLAAGKTEHSAARHMFKRLADEETKHERLLQDWANQGVCPVDVKFPAVDPVLMKRGKAKIDKTVQAGTTDLEAVDIGRDMERKAIAFYADSAAKATDPGTRDLFLRLKAEEDKHLALLTDLYDYLANPGLWSIRDEHGHFDA